MGHPLVLHLRMATPLLPSVRRLLPRRTRSWWRPPTGRSTDGRAGTRSARTAWRTAATSRRRCSRRWARCKQSVRADGHDLTTTIWRIRRALWDARRGEHVHARQTAGDRPRRSPRTFASRCSVLGAFTVARGESPLAPREIGSHQGRTLLKLLLAQRGHLVATDRIAEVLWGDQPPAKWDRAVAVLVSRLRGVLGRRLDRGQPRGLPIRAVRSDRRRPRRGRAAGRRVRGAPGGPRAGARPRRRRPRARAARPRAAAGGRAVRGLGRGGPRGRLRVAAANAARRVARGDVAVGLRGGGGDRGGRRFARTRWTRRPPARRCRRCSWAGNADARSARTTGCEIALGDALGADPAPETARLHVAMLREEPLPPLQPGPAVARGPLDPGLRRPGGRARASCRGSGARPWPANRRWCCWPGRPASARRAWRPRPSAWRSTRAAPSCRRGATRPSGRSSWSRSSTRCAAWSCRRRRMPCARWRVTPRRRSVSWCPRCGASCARCPSSGRAPTSNGAARSTRSPASCAACACAARCCCSWTTSTTRGPRRWNCCTSCSGARPVAAS